MEIFMDRRNFLRFAALTAAGILFGNDKASAYILDTWEPPIRKLFLQFTEYEERPTTEVIVIHHAGFPDGDKDSSAEDIHKFHRDVNGWAGIGYHYVIRKDGTIEQGRRPNMVGAHAYGHNKNSVGICVAGNFEIAKPNRAQMDSLKLLTAWLLNDTACPGENLYRKLDEIRRYCRDFE